MLNDLHLAHSDVLDKILSQCEQKFAFWLNLQNRLTTDVIVHPFTVHEMLSGMGLEPSYLLRGQQQDEKGRESGDNGTRDSRAGHGEAGDSELPCPAPTQS